VVICIEIKGFESSLTHLCFVLCVHYRFNQRKNIEINYRKPLLSGFFMSFTPSMLANFLVLLIMVISLSTVLHLKLIGYLVLMAFLNNTLVTNITCG